MTTNSNPGFYSTSINSAQAQAQAQAQHQLAGSSFKATSSTVGDASRLIVGGGEGGDALTTRATEFGRYTVNGNATPSDGASVTDTFRTPAGARVSPADVKPSHSVEISGMRTTVGAALAAGLLIKDADGSYRARGEAPAVKAHQPEQASEQPETNQNEQRQQDQQPAKVADLDATSHGYVQDFSSKVSNMTATSAMETMMNGEAVSEHDMAEIASQMGIEPGEVATRIETVRAAYDGQAREMMNRVSPGIDVDAVVAYAKQYEPALLREAVVAHIQQERADAYDALVRSFWMNLPNSNPEALLSANNARELDVRKEGNTIMVTIPNVGRMPFSAAVRAGFIIGKKR